MNETATQRGDRERTEEILKLRAELETAGDREAWLEDRIQRYEAALGQIILAYADWRQIQRIARAALEGDEE